MISRSLMVVKAAKSSLYHWLYRSKKQRIKKCHLVWGRIERRNLGSTFAASEYLGSFREYQNFCWDLWTSKWWQRIYECPTKIYEGIARKPEEVFASSITHKDFNVRWNPLTSARYLNNWWFNLDTRRHSTGIGGRCPHQSFWHCCPSSPASSK